MTVGLVLAVLALIVSAIVWAIGSNASNLHLASRGTTGVLVAIIGTLSETERDQQRIGALLECLQHDLLPDQDLVRELLGERRTAEILEFALESLRDQRLLGRVRTLLLPELERAPIGPVLQSTLSN